MNCKKCGAPLSEIDQFCKNCGAAVKEETAQDNMFNSANMSTQNEFNQVEEPVNSGMMNQPFYNQQPVNGGMMNQPFYNQQPVNNGMMNQPFYNQQPVNNGMMNQPMNNQQQKNSNTKFILIGVGAAVLIALIVLIFVLVGNNKSQTDEILTPPVNNTSTYKVKFKGFTFKIPTNLVYETLEESIVIGDEEGTWNTYIEVIEGSYAQLSSQKSQLQSAYQSMGFVSSAAIEKNIGGMTFITLEISKSGTNALLGLAKANSMNIFGLTAYNIDNEFDYDLLKTVSTILSSAEYNDETNNMSVFEKVDMSVISGLAQ